MTVTREAASTRLRFGMLGPLEATLDEQPLLLGGPRQRSVIAVLLLARGQVVTTDRLLDALWPVSAPRSAAGSLQAYVSHLRRLLEPDRPARAPSELLVSRGAGYALKVPEDAVDAWRFDDLVARAGSVADPAERATLLREALGLWRGPAMVEYAGQEWALADVHRLTELRDLAREQLLAARLDTGETAILVPEIEALRAEQPLREEPWRLLALAQYRSNRQGDALATLRRARALLAEELGIDPGPALRTLEAEILAQSDALRVPSAPAPATAPATRPVHPRRPAGSPVTPAAASPTLVDREPELARLRSCFEDAATGQAGLALIHGPAGIGKSSLLHEVRRIAVEAGGTVLTARGSQLEKAFGLGVVRQLFEPVLVDERSRSTLLTGAAENAGAVFDAVDDAHRSEGLFGVLHGLYWLTVNLAAQGPLVLAVDDLQWCDTGSLRYLAYLLHRLEGLPVLVVATLRTGERYDDEDLLNELSTDPATTPVTPGPLSRDGVAELVLERLGEAAEPFVSACHHTTSGNPLLLRQLLRALEAEQVRPDTGHADTVRAIGSRAVSSLVLMRFARMPEENRAVARSIAVLGDGASLPMVAAMTGLPEEVAASAIAALARAEVLRTDLPLGFVHPLVEDAVYNDLSAGERELAHDRAAGVLAAVGAAPEKIAAHLLVVPPRADLGVVGVLRDAAERALDRGAAESAVAYLSRCAAEPPAEEDLPRVLMELGRIETMTNGRSALDHLSQAYRTLRDPEARAETATQLARTLVFGGERGSATAVARTALDDLPPDLVDQRQGLLALERIGGYMHDLAPADYRAHERPEVIGGGTGARALAATLAWEDLITSRDRERAVSLARFALEDPGLRQVDAGLLWVVAAIVVEMGGGDTLDYWQEALADGYRRGALFAVLSAHLWMGWTQWWRGDLREALQSLANCAEQNQLWGSSIGYVYVDGFTVPLLLERGDVEGARRRLEEARPHDRFGEGIRLFGEAEAAVLRAEGRPAEALACLDAVAGHVALVRNPVWRSSRSQRAVLLHDLGHAEEALALVEDELRDARAWGTPELVGRTLRVMGELGPADRVDVLREAVHLLRERPQLLERAKAHAALGEALLVDGGPGDRPEAVASLRQALDLAATCGATPLRRRVADVLGDAGVDVPEEVPSRSSLTTTERRIVGLVLDGVPVRDIAESLFVTPRMVQATVASVSHLLGVTTQADLRSALAGA
jgi:DNA-binding SARP family transcriptional activator/DNA-binding CsgD family transcriptional regulator